MYFVSIIQHLCFARNFQVIALCICVSIQSLGEVKAAPPLSHEVDYFTRPNWPEGQVAAGVLCITNGRAVKGNKAQEVAGVVGHTALSFFEISNDEENHRMESSSVQSRSSIPFATFDFGKESQGKHQHVENYHVDHFLTMAHSKLYGEQNTRYCVQVSAKEKQMYKDYLAKTKNDRWTLGYNCGNFAIDAFMNILFPGRTLKQMRKNPVSDEEKAFVAPMGKNLILTPTNIFESINAFKRNYKVKGTLTYRPGPEDVKLLKYLETKGQITIPLFAGKPAPVEVPTVDEALPAAKVPMHFWNKR